MKAPEVDQNHIHHISATTTGFGISQEELNKLNENKSNPLLNRGISGLYPTGSTIKPFMASAGLEEKIITPQTSLYCPSTLCVESQFVSCVQFAFF
ncbi:MAG: hypothetical protein B7Z18_11920 [Alishewanella sp. 32-51-5]|nr:MAG: hypothetical protein B7Z18_11920 [Alishewanella sp. 32-51-5]